MKPLAIMGRRAKDTHIFVSTYKLLRKLHDIIIHFPRDEKHTYGQEIKYIIIHYLLRDIRIANDNIDKREEALEDFIGEFYTLGVLIKFCHDIGCISDKATAELSIMQDDIMRQCNAWRDKAKSMRES